MRLFLAGIALLALITPVALAFDGRVYLSGNGLLGIPWGDMAGQAPASNPGAGLSFGIGPRDMPATLGLGGHWFSFARQEFDGPTGAFYHNGEWVFGPTVVERAIELRHFDVVLRLQPGWRRIRPYAEATGGTGQYFVSWRQQTVWSGDTLDAAEASGDWTFTYGYGAGLDFEPARRWKGPNGSLGFVVSVGMRALHGGTVTNLGPSPDGAGTIAATGQSPIAMLVPFVGIGIYSVSSAPPRK